MLTGVNGLLPIQQWFLENEQPHPSHFNQSVLLGIDKKITEAVLKAAILKTIPVRNRIGRIGPVASNRGV